MLRLAAALALVTLAAAPVSASQCRANGKFVKCPEKKAVHCKANGKFVKCGTPGAKPV